MRRYLDSYTKSHDIGTEIYIAVFRQNTFAIGMKIICAPIYAYAY